MRLSDQLLRQQCGMQNKWFRPLFFILYSLYFSAKRAPLFFSAKRAPLFFILYSLYFSAKRALLFFSAKRVPLFFRTLASAALFFSIISVAFSSCAESDGDDALNAEFANWQARNEAFFATLEDSLRSNPDRWRKIKTFTKDENTEGLPTDYIYMKVLSAGDPYADLPLYTDSVRISYRGRLIPSPTYPEGYVFDQTYVGTYNVRTAGVVDGTVSEYTVGFATALQHMLRDEYCRVYIPYTLGYGESDKGAIPAFSTLIFDLTLVDYASDGKDLIPWD